MKEQTQIQKLATTLIKKWGKDEKTEHLSNKIGKFMNQFPKDSLESDIFLELIKHFDYYTQEKQRIILKNFNNIIYNVKGLDKKKVIYTTIEDSKGKINSSSTILEEFKILNEINNSFCLRIEKINDFKIENIVFFDDIIGSGETLKKFLTTYKESLKDSNLYIFCFIILDETLKLLKSFINTNNLKCEIIADKIQKKAFSQNYIFFENIDRNKKIALKREEKLWEKSQNKDNLLGYKQSEALVSFSRNTPNNTISSFWIEKEEWKGLFPRENDKPILDKKIDRKNLNNLIKGY